MIRPKPARWFEILAARDDATLVLEALATTGAVELEARPSAVLPAAFADIRPQLSSFAELASRYHAYWPPVSRPASPFPAPPSVTLSRSLAHLRAWAEDAEPVIRQLQRGETERAELLLWRRVLAAIGDSVIDFARLAGAGPILHARLFVFPPDSTPELPPGPALGTPLAQSAFPPRGSNSRLGRPGALMGTPLAQSAFPPRGSNSRLGRPGALMGTPLAQSAFPPRGSNSRLGRPGALMRIVELDGTMVGALAVLTVGDADDIQAIAQQAALVKGRMYDAPAWLAAKAGETERYVAPRLDALAREEQSLRLAIEALHAKHDLATALSDANRLQWVIQNVRALESGDLFCWITGWTSDFAGARLADVLARSGARALLHFPLPGPTARAPLLLDNPLWARPFEIFSRALGMPSRNEADPSVLLAIAVPLMFGYMFGDVGQGFVIAVAAFAVRKRFQIARLFIAGGLAAAIFGVLFGSVFSLHDAFPAVWINPLDDPLSILLVPLAGGAALLTIGLALNALEAWWRGELVAWLTADAGYVVAYLGILAGLVNPAGFVVAAAGALVFCLGHAFRVRHLPALLTAIAELVERLLQILINTLSFARVGAFALAHAGLSSAIAALMDASDNLVAKALVLVAGNAVVLVLEVMVVSIQTTRLVLFEFFTRFLTAEGRIFRPLPAPPSISQEKI
jgi:V/A-type H+-transporting ATPase subunit I